MDRDKEGQKLLQAAEGATPQIVAFLREMIAIPSESADEAKVAQCVADEMSSLGFDQVRIDGFGNVLGRIGDGPRVVALDGHIDTVGIGDPSTWKRDPYAGVVDNGVIYGRGASDQEGGVAAAVYGARLARDLGWLDGVTLWVTATVMEEDCDGLCWQYIVREDGLRPDVVVLTEATGLSVYRGHRGRMEIEVRTQGRSAHGSAPERGVNAIYKMAPVLADIEKLNEHLARSVDPFLGKGSVTISAIRSTSPSLCAVADSCTIHLDRRLTRGETAESALAEIQGLAGVRDASAKVTLLEYARPSYRGVVYPTQKYYPTWTLPEDHEAVSAGALAARLALGREPSLGHWTFSTNGVATAGMFGIPTIGFGPGEEQYAHTPDDQCPIADLTAAAAFYAAFPGAFARLASARPRPSGA
jgi:putative selenium metabolism hydrolase